MGEDESRRGRWMINLGDTERREQSEDSLARSVWETEKNAWA